jgi:hypothetical protein
MGDRHFSGYENGEKISDCRQLAESLDHKTGRSRRQISRQHHVSYIHSLHNYFGLKFIT